MRKGWRAVLGLWWWVLLGAAAVAAPWDSPREPRGAGSAPVRLTIDLTWAMTDNGDGQQAVAPAEGPSTPVVLEVSGGRVIEALRWPPDARERDVHEDVGENAGAGFGPGPDGSWRLGSGRGGRVRARIEASPGGSIAVRGGDQRVHVPLAALWDRPMSTPATAPLSLTVERPAWDALSVELEGPARSGIVEPLADVPLAVGFNVLGPESVDVSARASAVLRAAEGGKVVARDDRAWILPTNQARPAPRALQVRAPAVEGTYVLEVQASWGPVGHEGSRLGRLIHRRKAVEGAGSATRRTTLIVIAPKTARRPEAHAAEGPPSSTRSTGRTGRAPGPLVDSVDLARLRGRPIANGRSPLASSRHSAWRLPPEALIEPSRRDRLRGWLIGRGEAVSLGAADAGGLAWSAVGLKVSHPGRPHRLTLSIQGGEPARLGVALIEPGGGEQGAGQRRLLDACASGPPVLTDGPSIAFSWIVWPRSTDAVLVLVNRDRDAAVQPGTATLHELDGLPEAPVVETPNAARKRTLGLYLKGPRPLSTFEAGAAPGDVLTAARNLSRYLDYCGATAIVVPESVAERPARGLLDGQAFEDTTAPAPLEVLRRVLGRSGQAVWLEVGFDGHEALPGLPPPTSTEAAGMGLVVRGDNQAPGGVDDEARYHPLHPSVRAAMKRRLVEALAALTGPDGGATKGAPTGVLVRLGPGPTLLGTPDTGVDDRTFEQFVRETFSGETARDVPGLENSGPDRFAVRLRYLAGPGRMPWLTWRAKTIASLYRELADAARAAAPEALLALATPGLDDGPAGAESRRVDLAGLAPSQAWRSVGLDLQTWPNGPDGPVLLRGVALSGDALAHDLASSPDLDALVARHARRGLLLTIDDGPRQPATPAPGPGPVAGAAPASDVWLSALPLGDGPYADEPLEHALAALDAQWIFLEADAAAGHEERIRRFARAFLALPAEPGAKAIARARPFGTIVRALDEDDRTYLQIANDSPYPLRFSALLLAPDSAQIDDLGRGARLAPAPRSGGRELVLDLLPFGVSTIRVNAPKARVGHAASYPSEAVMAGLRARSRELSAHLARINRGPAGIAPEPANLDFEPTPTPNAASNANADANGGPLDDRPAAPSSASSSSSTGPGDGKRENESESESDSAVRPTADGTSDRLNDASAPIGWHLEPGPGVPGARPPEGPEDGENDALGPPKGASIAIDRDRPRSGRGSLRFQTGEAPASMVSGPFAPEAQTSLTIRAFFRAGQPGAAVRIWLEGESAGAAYVRRCEVAVTTDWEARAVRASDLPPGGLDSARLRIEPLAPGTIWIDDLSIEEGPMSKSARLNARRTLLAALQAYRERRFADFARLASSHWAQPPWPRSPERLARGQGASTSASGPAPADRAGAANGLPPNRAVR